MVPTGAGLVDGGGVDQGPWLQGGLGGGVGAMAIPGLVGYCKSEGVREGLAWRSGGGARASVAGG